MADGTSWDFSDLTKLAADLGEVPKSAGGFINSAMQRTAGNVKKAARDSVKGGSSRWKAAVPAIDYDVKVEAGAGGSALTIEVGYNKDMGGGPLGNLREFGAPGANLAPHNDLANALEANKDDFQHGLDEALKDAEKKAGL